MLTRRNLLKIAAGLLASDLPSWPDGVSAADAATENSAADPQAVFPQRALWLHRVQTQEEGRVLYYQENTVVPDGYSLLCYLLRDVRVEQVIPIDLKLIHLLFGMQTWMRACGIRQPLRVNSGYRTPQTNANTEGAAVHSRHLSGQAADFTVEGIPSEVLAALARRFNVGGVGVYRTFVHVDTGPVRMWKGN